MVSSNYFYKVTLIVGSIYDNVDNPVFFFHEDDRERMQNFIDILLEHGEEVVIVKEQDNPNKEG